MNIKQCSILVLATLIASNMPLAAAAEATPGKTDPAFKMPVYKPPLRGAPASRVGGGSRGVDSGSAPRIAVLAPDHTGYTTHEQPSLYWYLSKPVATRLEITVTNDQSVKPLLEKKLEIPAQAGIQRLSLKDLGIRLKPGIEYRWFVGLVSDPQQRSNDIIASGTIERKEMPQSLAGKLSRADGKAEAFIYAEEGYWYDAIASVSELIASRPGDASLRQQRAALLDQVGLDEAAQLDRGNP